MTAVEFLFNKLFDALEKYKLGEIELGEYISLIMEARELAKQMEKKQIIEAATRWHGTDFAEQYYNEKYGGKK